MTDKSADRTAEATETIRARKRAWGWARIILEFYKFLEVVHSDNLEPDQYGFVKRNLSIFPIGLHENAEIDMMQSDLRESYIEFSKGKNGDQLARGIITHSEYWQQFARLCYGGDQ